MWKHKSFILLGSAILIALVTTMLIVRVLQKKALDKERASIETQPIAVAMADLSWGTSLTKDMIKVVPFPKEYVPPGCFSSAETLAGRVLVYPVKMNEPIFESRLAPKTIQAGGVAALISPKKRAVAVKVDKVILDVLARSWYSFLECSPGFCFQGFVCSSFFKCMNVTQPTFFYADDTQLSPYRSSRPGTGCIFPGRRHAGRSPGLFQPRSVGPGHRNGQRDRRVDRAVKGGLGRSRADTNASWWLLSALILAIPPAALLFLA